MRHLTVVIALCFTVLSCTLHTQYRGTAPPLTRPIVLDALERRDPVDDDHNGQECSELLLRKRSVEKFVKTAGRQKPDYSVGVIELSDDGHIKDIAQARQVIDSLKAVVRTGDPAGKSEQATAESKGAVVVVFVHGWHHRAKVCDENLSCFRRVLEGLTGCNADANRRPVFGIYLAWRGESAHHLPNLTFYSRKRTAHHVGERGGAHVLLQLNDLHHDLNEELARVGSGRLTMITVGHSFGGALVYSAMEALRVTEYEGEHVVDFPQNNGVKPLRKGVGDLVILVNPAFEAERYRFFAEDLATAGRYAGDQLPVMLTVASQADGAVGAAFPAGRSLWLAVHPNHWKRARAELLGVGHYEPYTTHDLRFEGVHADKRPLGPPISSDAARRCELEKELKAGRVRDRCDCSYEVFDPCAVPQAAPDEKLAGSGYSAMAPGGMVRLLARGQWDPNSPFIVASAPGNLIDGHNDIYNKNFVAFLSSYIASYIIEQQQARVAGTRTSAP